MKTSSIFLILFLVASLRCSAQSKWKFGVAVAPEFSAPYNPANLNRFSKKEYPRSRFGYSIGIVALKQQRRWLYYQIGLQLANTRFSDVNQFEVVGSGRPIEAGVSVYQSLAVILPFNLHFRLVKPESKWGFVASLGPGAAWTIQQKREISTSWYHDVIHRKDLRSSPDRLHVEARMGPLIKIGDNRTLLVESSIRLSIIDVLGRMNYFDEHSRSIGVRFTIY